MRIQEICESCHLTKKAVAYYEKQGLIHPTLLDNGYRDYSEADRAVLCEIAVLRALEIGVEDIRKILQCPDVSAKESYLSSLYSRKAWEREQRQEKLSWLKELSHSYQPGAFFDDVLPGLRTKATVQERLTQAFPGTWGQYLAWHFGRYLGHAIETQEQKEAYAAILEWVDQAEPWELPEEYAGLMRVEADTWKKADEAVLEAIEDVDGYIEKHGSSIETYQQYCQSEEYQSSPLGRLQQWMVTFQTQSGYIDIFLKNMRKLSPSYRMYMGKMEAANARLLERYPGR